MARTEDLLSTLEQLFMTAILLLDNDAYGAAIYDKAAELARPGKVSYGSLYPTLERLEKKGFLASAFGDPIPERGGKARRYFSLTGRGQAVLRQSGNVSQRIVERLSEAWGMS